MIYMESRKARIFKNIVWGITVPIVFFACFLSFVCLGFNSLYITTQVRGFSMQPTININMENESEKGDTIYINKYASFTRNDIVVADVDWHEHYIIKRVVGVPGDKIRIVEEFSYYSLYVNDEILYNKGKYGENNSFPKSGSYAYYEYYKNFLNNHEFNEAGLVGEDENGKYIKLGEGDYFLMGDNWGHTTDSLTKGPIKKNEVVGKVDLIIDVEDNYLLESIKFFLKKLFIK